MYLANYFTYIKPDHNHDVHVHLNINACNMRKCISLIQYIESFFIITKIKCNQLCVGYDLCIWLVLRCVILECSKTAREIVIAKYDVNSGCDCIVLDQVHICAMTGSQRKCHPVILQLTLSLSVWHFVRMHFYRSYVVCFCSERSHFSE